MQDTYVIQNIPRAVEEPSLPLGEAEQGGDLTRDDLSRQVDPLSLPERLHHLEREVLPSMQGRLASLQKEYIACAGDIRRLERKFQQVTTQFDMGSVATQRPLPGHMLAGAAFYITKTAMGRFTAANNLQEEKEKASHEVKQAKLKLEGICSLQGDTLRKQAEAQVKAKQLKVLMKKSQQERSRSATLAAAAAAATAVMPQKNATSGWPHTASHSRFKSKLARPTLPR